MAASLSYLEERLRERRLRDAGDHDSPGKESTVASRERESRPPSSRAPSRYSEDAHIDKLQKANFALKLEVDQRRSQTRALQHDKTRLEERAAQLEADNAELLSLNEDLVAELEKRDAALEEALTVICRLEKEAGPPSTAHADSGYGAAPSVVKAWGDLGGDRGSRLTLKESLQTLTLRHLDSVRSLKSLRERDNEEVSLVSPRLSVLSECSFGSVGNFDSGAAVDKVQESSSESQKSINRVNQWMRDKPDSSLAYSPHTPRAQAPPRPRAHSVSSDEISFDFPDGNSIITGTPRRLVMRKTPEMPRTLPKQRVSHSVSPEVPSRPKQSTRSVTVTPLPSQAVERLTPERPAFGRVESSPTALLGALGKLSRRNTGVASDSPPLPRSLGSKTQRLFRRLSVGHGQQRSFSSR
ncbi:hypothetical protein K470DRAFT_270509 [Piedraia hortae CBS 480.64]|uniref:Uncharacterized protein n=1 Tax=Piedraia hortae CBS 480.64 TaxID=1314780 RepID=A0A6A7BZN3_9PEZI|nr:hypothetical protein K470DRAFT_270509 [Piedraia hortae CBS 480.64]